MIVKTRAGYEVRSKDGSKRLGGPYASREKALKRLRQVEYFKSQRDPSARTIKVREEKGLSSDQKLKLNRVLRSANMVKRKRTPAAMLVLQDALLEAIPGVFEQEIEKAEANSRSRSLAPRWDLHTLILFQPRILIHVFNTYKLLPERRLTTRAAEAIGLFKRVRVFEMMNLATDPKSSSWNDVTFWALHGRTYLNVSGWQNAVVCYVSREPK